MASRVVWNKQDAHVRLSTAGYFFAILPVLIEAAMNIYIVAIIAYPRGKSS